MGRRGSQDNWEERNSGQLSQDYGEERNSGRLSQDYGEGCGVALPARNAGLCLPVLHPIVLPKIACPP